MIYALQVTSSGPASSRNHTNVEFEQDVDLDARIRVLQAERMALQAVDDNKTA